MWLKTSKKSLHRDYNKLVWVPRACYYIRARPYLPIHVFLPLEAELTETVTHNKVGIFYVVLYVKKNYQLIT